MFFRLKNTSICWLILVFSIIVSSSAFGEQPLPKKTLVRPSASYLLRTPREQHKQGEKGIIVQSPASGVTELVSVTDVKVNTTDKGLEVILTTPESKKLQVTPRSEGNSYIADIPNTQLKLPNGGMFRLEKPATGIAEITVVNQDTSTIRVTVTGEVGVPTVELFDSTQKGLVFGVTSTTSTAQQPTTTSPTQQKPTEEREPAIELEVTASPDTYRVPNTSIGTKTDTPLQDIPQSIQVLPRQLVQDQGANKVGEVLRNVGLVPSGFSSRTSDGVIIRGFAVDANNILRNGIRDYAGAFGYGNDLANIEQIEVLRGPASVLYGQGRLGGAINLITKQPLQQPYYAAQFKIGSYQLYEPSIDFSGPLTSDKKVLYRLNAAYTNSGSFVDFQNIERFYLAPVVSWQLGKDTKLTIEGDYLDTKQSFFELGLPASGTVLPNPNGKIKRDRYLGEPGLSRSEYIVGRLGYDFEHRFSNNWSLRNTFRFAFVNYPDDSSTRSLTLLANNRTLNRDFSFYTDTRVINTYGLDTNIVGKFKTGSIQHQLLFGIEWYKYIFASNSFAFRTLGSIDIFNPVYGQTTPGAISSRSNFKLGNDQIGLYIQDQITLNDNLKFLLGGRWDFVNNKLDNLITSTVTEQSDSAFSPRIGIVYQPIKPISLYASYSRSFEQITGTDAQGNAFQPSRGNGYEVGVKTDLFNNKVSATLALFDITRTNITTPDPNNTRFSIQTGEQRSQGVELFVTGELAPGWNIIASYNYTDPRITKDTRSILVGNLLNNAPEHSASLWTKYTISNGDLQGLGFGVGIFYVGDKRSLTAKAVSPR